ncbi:MAG: DUF4145 domain-containing protein [Planctomycetes bacterium]|nr:DUF4145 domain-containing protein [Planctomycetota bacterium]
MESFFENAVSFTSSQEVNAPPVKDEWARRKALQNTQELDQLGAKVAEIEEFVKRSEIPSHLTKSVDAIRNIGNFAAHPLKDINTGEIVDVEPGEAEWLIEVLFALLDFTFVQPKLLKDRKKKLNEKLKRLGKPTMK